MSDQHIEVLLNSKEYIFLLNVTPVFVAKYIHMQFFHWKLEEEFFFFPQGKKLS